MNVINMFHVIVACKTQFSMIKLSQCYSVATIYNDNNL